MIDALFRARYAIFAAVVALLVALLWLDRHVQYEQSLTAFFPDGDPAVVAYQRASAAFGNDNFVFITYDDPDLLSPDGMRRLSELAGDVTPGKIEAVTDVQSLDAMPLFWQIDDGLTTLMKLPALARRLAVNTLKANFGSMSRADSPFTVGGAIRGADPSDLEPLRDRITSHPLLVKSLVSADGRSTSIIVRLRPMEEQEPKATIASLRQAADSFAERHGLTRPALVGPPVLLADGFSAIERDGRRLALVGMGLIGLVTLSITRSLWWAIVPILASWTVWLAAEAAMATLGLKLSLSGGPLVAQIIVLTMPAASHLAIHFRDGLRNGLDRRASATYTLRAVWSPIFWTATTGAIGYAALLSSNVVPIFQFGAVLAACTVSAAFLTAALSPVAMLPPIPLELPVRPGSDSQLVTLLNGLTRKVEAHPAAIVLGILAIVLPLGAGIVHTEYESNYINAFRPDTRVVQDYHFTESRLGGIGVVSLVVPASTELDTETIEAHRRLGAEIADLRLNGREAVSQVVSLATVLDPEGKLAALSPDQSAEALRIKLELIAASPQSDLLRGFWRPQSDSDATSGWARLVIRIPEAQPAADKEAVFRQAEALGRVEFSDSAHSPYVTGLSYLLTQTTRGVMASSWVTFAWSAAGILLMLTLAFRGPRLAALAILPTLLAVTLVMGVSAWLGVKLDIATALVASVALGLSVDDTFHCLLQFRRHRALNDTFEQSLRASYHVTGPGVVLSSLAVAIGFAVLRFSEFLPFSNFGTMVGIATLGSSIGNLVLLPALLTLGHRFRGRGLPEPRSEPEQVEVGETRG